MSGELTRYVRSVECSSGCGDGDLTFEHGFLPRRLRHSALSGAHNAWEQAAEALPELVYHRDPQSVLAQIPLVPAGPDDLADADLKRAAVVLGMIAHSYWRFGIARMYTRRNNEIDQDLPLALREPWTEVCRRLGRNGPSLTLEDWVFNNFTFLDASLVDRDGSYSVDDVRIKGIRLQVPAYGNDVEQVFTAAFAEIHAPLAAAVRALCRIDDAIGAHGTDAVEVVCAGLEEITRSTKKAVAAFRKISPRSNSHTYCDPVGWSKTMAMWAVPAPGYPAGPSGSASPLVHFFDALIGRNDYSSRQGAFAREMRGSQLPRKLEAFFDLVQRSNLRGYVECLALQHRDREYAEAREAFNDLIASFSGPNGFLVAHKGKVVNYLGVGTVVGRNQSTGHDQTYLANADWTAMADELGNAIMERERRRIS